MAVSKKSAKAIKKAGQKMASRVAKAGTERVVKSLYLNREYYRIMQEIHEKGVSEAVNELIREYLEELGKI